MTFAVAAGYGMAICVATAALMQLSKVALPWWSPARVLVACRGQSRPVQARLFGRKGI
jgi:hypothetical protein